MFGGQGTTFHLDVSPDIQQDTPLVRGYGDDYLHIAAQRYHHGVSIHQGAIHSPWGPEAVHQLTEEHLNHLKERPPEVLIIGTGRRTMFPCTALMMYLQEIGFGFECMDSRSAARTYNILVGEGRRVSAVFFLPHVRR